MGPSTLFTIPVLRDMKTYGLTHEQLGDGLGRAARMGGEEPARHIQDASASCASRGHLAMTCRYAAAGASGWRRPCSQFFSVASGMR